VSTTAGSSVTPIALAPDQGEALWFMGSLLTIKASGANTGGGVTVIENLAPQGGGSPLHVHHREDEWFYVIEGTMTFWVGGEIIEASAGSFVYGPRDIPHTFVVTSAEARFLLVAEPGGFDAFARALSEPAQTLTIPPPPSEEPDMAALSAVAAEYGMELLGPPGIPA
jgi:quercetin dioxygenase-like cupin family protein